MLKIRSRWFFLSKESAFSFCSFLCKVFPFQRLFPLMEKFSSTAHFCHRGWHIVLMLSSTAHQPFPLQAGVQFSTGNLKCVSRKCSGNFPQILGNTLLQIPDTPTQKQKNNFQPQNNKYEVGILFSMRNHQFSKKDGSDRCIWINLCIF